MPKVLPARAALLIFFYVPLFSVFDFIFPLFPPPLCFHLKPPRISTDFQKKNPHFPSPVMAIFILLLHDEIPQLNHPLPSCQCSFLGLIFPISPTEVKLLEDLSWIRSAIWKRNPPPLPPPFSGPFGDGPPVPRRSVTFRR